MPHDVGPTLLITGGGGMLAKAVTRACEHRGWPADARPRAALDITDPAAVAAALDESRANVLFNCAAHTKVDLCEQQQSLADEINGHAVGVLADACARRGATLVHVSTDFVFDGTAARPYRPADATNPLGAYGRSKRLGEELAFAAAARGADVLVIRTSWLFGPGGPCFPQTMVKLAKAGKPLKVVADQVGSPTYTRDLADAACDLLAGGHRRVFHVTNTGATTWHDFTAAILQAFGVSTGLSPTTSAEWFKLKPDSAARPAYSVLDVTDTERAIGRPLRPWPATLADYRDEVERNGF